MMSEGGKVERSLTILGKKDVYLLPRSKGRLMDVVWIFSMLVTIWGSTVFILFLFFLLEYFFVVCIFALVYILILSIFEPNWIYFALAIVSFLVAMPLLGLAIRAVRGREK